ncbi:MAG: hypothetical protein IJS13_06075 [Paludibacteraceae bacterium]|nr:hypothetical protein [Paludibacteraceae bacterium]
MKKILLFCAALVAAMNMSATITSMTCAEAKQATLDNLQSGETGTDSVAVTGYVTNTNGSISRGQQTFWLDDQKGTAKTFQAYWCNMPEGENPLNVGDKVTIKGFLMNYQGTTAEMKNGDVVILQRVEVNIDTLEVSACDAIEEGESLNAGAVSDDYFSVSGRVVSVDMTNEQYMQETFWIECAENQKRFEAYYVTIQGNEFAEIGDSVMVIGKLTNFNGTTIEIANGKAWIVEKGEKQATPQLTVAQALSIGNELAQGAKTDGMYIIIGYVDSISSAYSEQYGNISFFMTDDINTPAYEFEVYRGKFNADIALGTKVYVLGQIQHYYKAAVDGQPEVDKIQLTNGTVYLENPENALEDINTNSRNGLKVIENGQVFIERDGIRYNVLGTQVK